MVPDVVGSNPIDRPIFTEEPLTYLQALILALVQGLTEFFPVSSSAHLRLARWFLGMAESEHFLSFDLVCHAGTLLALLLYLRRDLKIFRNFKAIPFFALALFPLVPAYFLFRSMRLSPSSYLGYGLLLTALLLFVASRKPPPVLAPAKLGAEEEDRTNLRIQKYKDVLFIGVMQALALMIPGLSRSGSTVAAARVCGWEWKEAARFSFLLSIPAILGGQLLEGVKLMKQESSLEVGPLVLGFLASFGMGLLAVRFIFWIYEKEKVRPFAWYCLGVGLLAAMFYGQTAI